MSTSSLDSGLLAAAAQRQTARTARISSWDQSGLNEDAFVVQPGETAVLADIEGPISGSSKHAAGCWVPA